MILGLGTDIVEINRVRDALEKHGVAFAKQVLAPDELLLFEQRKNNPEFLAGRWAAKEAFAKALGTGIGKDCSFSGLTILPDEKNAPRFTAFAENTEKILFLKGIKHCHLSISHERDYAVATVILEG
mgnify:CR=1 FL=1